ncbi:endonuclease/exonuclease/phosphatase family protein [Streptomyces sp. NPDC051561]|uniref:endonuclease/exonuclease/phosphatase family protein n=1 Tax=Streptomyces sp. NPDC051561 TaxID=3365658 RepID=UPI00378875C5
MPRPSLFVTFSVAASLALPALLGSSGAPAPAPAAERGTVRIMTYNICGSACPDSKGYETRRRVEVVAGQAVGGRWKADQVHLQEVCRGQYDKVLARLAPHGFTGRFTATKGKIGACKKKDYGAAVLVRAKIRDTVVLDVTQGVEPERFKVPCVRSTLRGRDNWACSVHLYSQEQGPRRQQARELATQAAKWRIQGVPVVLAGDFNASPLTREMGEFYGRGAGGGAHGRFVEADERDKRYFDHRTCASAQHSRCRSGEPTFGRKKIDYIFLSEGDFVGVKADARKIEHKVSDHHMLRATATWDKAGSAK